MRSRSTTRDAQTQQRLAKEAARVMRDGGIRDFGVAKRKALEQLRLPARTPLPRNQDIEQALAEHQRLFGGSEHAAQLLELREMAITAMRELREFEPKLVGAVLSGTADSNAVITLHLFADTIEEVAWSLLERGIDHRNSEHKLRMSTSEVEFVPGFSFVAGGKPIELLIFCGRSRRRTPVSTLDGRAMQRASLLQVQRLVNAADDQANRAVFD
jgi:hypothetical protein